MTKNVNRMLVLVAYSIAILSSFSTLVDADDYEPSDYFASIGVANNPAWMSLLPDNRLLSDLSIPGTHDSMAVWGNLGSQPPTPTGLTNDITKVQQRFNENGRDSLYRQFQSGIRAVDIRVVFTWSSDKNDPIPVPQFAIHHGPIYQYANFYDTMSAASEFLTQNPSETILLRLKLESGSDDDSSQFPSVLQKYRDNRPMGAVFYDPSVSGSISVPRLGDVRGKMVLMTLLGKGGGTYGAFGINSDSIDTQDEFEFQLPNAAVKKFSYVKEQLKKTADPANRDKIMINFVSANTKFGTFIPGIGVNGPAAIAHDINEMVWSYLDKEYADQPRTGIFMFDYPGWKLIEKVIDFNKKSERKVNGKKPDLGDRFTTFKVKAGPVSFDASIPAEAMATYIWGDDSEPIQWLTTAKSGGFGYKFERFGVTSEGSVSSTIEVNPGRRYQTIDGFGAALTDSAAHLIANSPKRNEIMRKLFGTGKGEAGLTIARVAMGASDLMYDANNIYTYEDQPGSFSIDKDGTTIDLLKQAKSISGGKLKILATPWSAPGWMKRGKSLLPKECGSDLNQLDPKYYAEYANYFKKFIDAYSNAGVRPWMVSMQNEPQNCKTQMPTTELTSEDEIHLSRHLKRVIPADVKVLGWDHNWNDPLYVNSLVNEGSVDAIGYHCYDGTNYKDQTQRVSTYLTECSGFTDQSTNVPGNQGWEVINTIIGPLRYGSKGSMYWSMVQRSDGSPSLAGNDACKTCRGMITISNDGNSFEPSQDFYFWAHIARFAQPGSVRIESSQSGDLSTVAFRRENKNILFVINSASNKADGGSPGSDNRDLRRHIVQWDGDKAEQKAAWLVGIDGYRRWISDGSTFNCLKYDAGMQGPIATSSGSLDRYINIKDSWAVCGSGTMGTRSELEVGTYLKSDNGARLTLTQNGLTAVDSRGQNRWAPPGKGDRLILQEDQNLVLYNGRNVVWTSDTKDSGAVWLSVRDDGSFALFNKDDKKVWSSEIKSADYLGKIVQWDNDRSEQKASWLVGADGKRRWIHDWDTYKCLRNVGLEDSYSVSSDILEQLENLDNVWATCGGDRIGPYGALERRSYLKAGDCMLSLTENDLKVLQKGKIVWTTGKGGEQLLLQTDGNLVIYNKNRNPTWATYTDGKKPGWLVLGDDCSLRLYDSNNEKIWERESNVYTLGDIGAHRIVCTKLPTVGHTREAMTAAGNTTTRLLGTFQKVDYVFLVGVGGGVPHYTDYKKHVRLGDVVVSYPTRLNNKFVYMYCESAKAAEDGSYHFDTKEYCPTNLGLQDIAANLKKEVNASDGFNPPWQNHMRDGLKNLGTQSEHNFEAPPVESDKLYMNIGERDVIEVAHPSAPKGDNIYARNDGCPQIHLAPVASGRRIARDDQLRQKFSSRFGILAFDAEMDAVVDSILGNCRDSFAVVRGIADYKDGSRGKEWQPYASLAAASVVKAMICAMDPPSPCKK